DSERLVVWTYDEVLPRELVPTDLLATAMKRIPGWPKSVNCAALNRHRPWRPVRGWVLQQIVKMCMVDRLDVDMFLNIDSDVALVRPLSPEHFLEDGTVRLYTRERSIRPGTRHHRWTQTAHELLGLPWDPRGRYPDHIAGLVSWDVGLLRRCLQRVEAVTGKPWAAAVGEQLHFSEDILYGTYVRAFGTDDDLAHERDTTLCHSHWDIEALELGDVDGFVAEIADEDRAVHIQSNTDTEERVFRA